MASARAICNNNGNFKNPLSKSLGLHVFYVFVGTWRNHNRILLENIYFFPLINSNNGNLLGKESLWTSLLTNYFQLFKMLTDLNLNKAFNDSD